MPPGSSNFLFWNGGTRLKRPAGTMAAGFRSFRHWPELCVVALAGCLWLLAFQRPHTQTIHVGGDVALARRDDDEPFLRGANQEEPAERLLDPDRSECQAAQPPGDCRLWWWELLRRTGGLPWRWTTAETTLLVPGVGGASYLVEVLAQSGRPDGSPALSVWTPGDLPPLELSLSAGSPRRYRLLVPPSARGDLRLTMRTTPYAALGDPRELGFVLHRVQLRDAGSPLRAPAWPVLGWLSLTVGVIYTLARALQAGRYGSLALAGGAALAAAVTLALARPALTLFTAELGLLAVSCAALAAAAWPLARRLAPRAASREVAHVLALVLLAFALRMAGMLHPQAIFSDLGFHANRLFAVTMGQVFLTSGLPDDAGGGQQPYPPGAYLFLLPGQLLASDGEARRLLVQGGTALLDSLAVALIWLLLRRAGLGPRAAAFGAACYLLPTPALESFSIGEYANLGGQALALPLLALLGLGLITLRPPDPRAQRSPRPLLLLTAAVALALLGHSGVTLSVGALLAAAWVFAWVARLRERNVPINPVLLTGGIGLGLGAVLLIYYTAPLYLSVLAERAGRAASGTPPLQVLADTARALLGLVPPQNTRVALPPLLGPAAVAGLVILLTHRNEASAPLRALLAAWWAGTAITMGLLVVSGQGVRWAIFLYPALCAGAGVCLDAVWRRGRTGRLAALAALAVILSAGLFAWIVQIRDFIHL